MSFNKISVRALSDFDGDFLPDLGTQQPPAEICPDNSSLSPHHTYIGSKDAAPGAATFKPIFKAIGFWEDVRRYDVRRGSSVPISGV